MSRKSRKSRTFDVSEHVVNLGGLPIFAASERAGGAARPDADLGSSDRFGLNSVNPGAFPPKGSITGGDKIPRY
jgi:hypothetical protein